jgi:hypothetical protein
VTSGYLDTAAVEALTRSGLGRGGPLSDEDLIRKLARTSPDLRRLSLLSGTSQLLRLMDGLLAGKETGEGFVGKFSELFLSLTDWEADPVLKTAFEELNDFYSRIQLFSALPHEIEEEPSLFGLTDLKDRTQLAYVSLKEKWSRSLEGA